MKPSVQRVHDALTAAGLEPRIVELGEVTRTAEEAAAAIGTTIARIVKSLVFLADDEPIIVLASGENRVDTGRVGRELGKTLRRADADRVRVATGYAIGGVAPIGYPAPLQTLLDRDLLQHDVVWAAAGAPNAVFPIAPADLLRVTGARVLDVRQL
ncbi:MAG: YbaK/EbsC family protein [Solirubrobacterales bacterium]|nr:YbaK/EbsC family protein [Solirubrobacterales bacterium]